MKSGEPPVNAIAASTTAVASMLLTRICLRPSAVGKMASQGRRGKTRGLQSEQAGADPEGRIAHLMGEVYRQEREQRGLRHGAECRAGREQDERTAAEDLLEPAEIILERLYFVIGL